MRNIILNNNNFLIDDSVKHHTNIIYSCSFINNILFVRTGVKEFNKFFVASFLLGGCYM